MICNKCGKNNPAGADKCSFCKELMPATTNCGGFSDILTYTAPVAPDTAPAVQPAPIPVRQVIEPQMDEPWYASILSKKNLISLAAILLCVITLIVVIISSCSKDADDFTGGNPVTVSEEQELEELFKDVFLISSSDDSFPEYKFEKDETDVKIELKDKDGKAIDIMFVCVDKEKNLIIPMHTKDSKISKDMFEADFSICFKADKDKFPIKIYFNGDAAPFDLVAGKDKTTEWVPVEEKEKDDEKETGSSSSEEPKIPDFVKKPVTSPADKQEVQVVLRSDDFSFPEGAKTATLVIKGGNNKNISNERIFVVGSDGKDAKTVSGIYSKEEFDNIEMIVVNVLANSELINNSVKEVKFTKVS